MTEIVSYLKQITKQDESSFIGKMGGPPATESEQGRRKSKSVFTGLLQMGQIPSKEAALKIVQRFWSMYDVDGNGVLDRDEARKLVSDIVKELQEDFKVDLDRFSYLKNFDTWFNKVDVDLSNTIDIVEAA